MLGTPVTHGSGNLWGITITASSITSDGSAMSPTIRIGTQVRSLRCSEGEQAPSDDGIYPGIRAAYGVHRGSWERHHQNQDHHTRCLRAART